MEETLGKLVTDLKTLYGNRLVALFLYGSAVSGDYHEKFSDLNILCVLSEISVDLLRKAEKTIAWFVKQGNATPLFLSREEIEHSHDVFPIEFLDIQANHRLLFGEDIFRGLDIARENHRLELEHEVRTKLIALRQGYLMVCRDAQAVEALMLRSFSAFITLFRHTLILMGHKVPPQKRDIVELFCSKSNLDESLFLSLLKLREEGRSLTSTEVGQTFERYFGEIGKLVKLVNQLPKAKES
jgi:predicted nucleotidyltransferase